ncbi:MAG: NAD-dependent epimerase/dehydratase family protein [Egibacteraceae bacterium]
MRERAFVTGGSGFVGRSLLRRLQRDGWAVRALARSSASARTVAQAGAQPVSGDLDNLSALIDGASGCTFVFHLAANVNEWGRREEFERVNVLGTRRVLEACRLTGVRRMIHVSTEAAVMAGQPLVNVSEQAPLRPDSRSHYCATKAVAEREVLQANGEGVETVVVRPRLVWGPGDTTLLPALLASIHSGRFRWVGHGRHRTSTAHVENVVEGLMLAARVGRPGRTYFVTDGDPVVFRDFIEQLVATQGIEIPDRSIPPRLARALAATAESLWSVLPLQGSPPLTRTAVWLSSLEVTIDIARAVAELGYQPVKTVPEGLAELGTQARGAEHGQRSEA